MPDPISWSLALPYLLTALAGGYALGSIPFGLLFARLSGSGDLRRIGSGNIGTTNALRAGGVKLAAATLLADAAKGTIAVLLAANYGPDLAVAAGAGAFLGHLFPLWLQFRGGKGSATMLGVLLGLFWPLALIYALAYLLAALVTRYSSIASLAAAAAAPPVAIWFGEWQIAELAAFFAVLMFIRHHANIRRLLSGQEPRIGQKS